MIWQDGSRKIAKVLKSWSGVLVQKVEIAGRRALKSRLLADKSTIGVVRSVKKRSVSEVGFESEKVLRCMVYAEETKVPGALLFIPKKKGLGAVIHHGLTIAIHIF